MNAGRLPLFCDTALAWRIERAEAQFVAKASEAAHRRRADDAGFVIPVAGGVASFAEAGSPYNKVAGLGFGGVPGPATWDEIERAYAALGAPVRVELAHLADPAIGVVLTGRGYRLILFDNVLGLVLPGEPERVTPRGVEVRPSSEDEFESWLDIVLDGFAHPDTQGVPLHDELAREVIAGAGRDFAAAGGFATSRCATGSSPAAPAFAWRRASRSSPARRQRLRTAAGGCRPRCCRPGSPTPRPLVATSPSLPRCQDPSLSRTCSGRASTCSIPAPLW